MFEGSELITQDSVGAGNVTIEQARDYEQRRFTRQRRMKRLDRFEKAFAQRLFDMVGSDAHIVDIPCGNGRFFHIFSKAEKLIMADYSENMLKAAKERFGTPENVKLLQTDISSIPLHDGSADVCFCMRLFHHMKNDEIRLAALKELARISKKYVALSFYNKSCPRYYWRKVLGKKIRGHYVSFPHMVDLAKKVGLVPAERFPKLNFFEQQCLAIFQKEDKLN
jgi:ubiquinone/menaquinone biosynthesis C-methylase UbiE